MKSAPAIAFDYAPSRRLAAVAALMAMLAVVGVLKSGLAPSPQVILAVLVPIYAVIGLRRFLVPPFVRVARDASGWQLVGRAGDGVAATLRTHRRLGPLLVLEFELATRQRFRFVLTADVIDAELRRRLLLVLATEPHARIP